MFVPQRPQTPESALLSSALLVASHSSLSPDSWWCFWCFPNVSELPSDAIILECLFPLRFPVLTQTCHTFLLSGCMCVVIRWFTMFVLVFLLAFFLVAMCTLLGAVMVSGYTSDIWYQLKAHRRWPTEVKEQTLPQWPWEFSSVLLFFVPWKNGTWFVCFDQRDLAPRFLLSI